MPSGHSESDNAALLKKLLQLESHNTALLQSLRALTDQNQARKNMNASRLSMMPG
jgi:hypothetical protein